MNASASSAAPPAMWIDAKSSEKLNTVPRRSWCALHRPVSTTTERGFELRMYSAASWLFIMCDTPNSRDFCMPSSNGLSSVPGSLSTTSTNAAVGRSARATAEARREVGDFAVASRAATLIFGATPPATTRAAAAEAIAEWGGGRLVRGNKPSPRADRDDERERASRVVPERARDSRRRTLSEKPSSSGEKFGSSRGLSTRVSKIKPTESTSV